MGNYSTPEAYVFNDGNSNNLWPLMACMGGGFGGGYNSPLWAIILLAFLRNGGIFGNGNNSQLSQIQDTLNTNQGNQLIMSAIQGNATSIKELASLIGCNHNAVTSAINGIQSAVCGVGNQLGMSTASVVNAINSGNMSIANQISQCCCDVKTESMRMGYENQINNLNQSNMITKGFGDVATATQMQTSALTQSNDCNTRSILAKLDAIEDSRKDREIATLTAQLASVNARAERQAELAPIVQKLNDIQCRQPATVTLPYSCATAVPTSMLYSAGLFGFPYANGGNFG